MIYLQLFLSFFQIGLFSFGGGYAAMPLIQGQIVKIHGWMTMSRVHGFDHYIPDDSRPYSGQFGDICGTPGGWICRRGGCHARNVYFLHVS